MREHSPRAAMLVVMVTCLTLGAIATSDMRFLSIAHGQPLPWSTATLATMPRWTALAALMPFVLLVGVRHVAPGVSVSRARSFLVHAALFFAISLAHGLVLSWTFGLTVPFAATIPWIDRLPRSWYTGLPTVIPLYAAACLAAWGLTQARERQLRSLRASQLEAQLQAARLEALRAKLQPHFLHNTLTAIAALIADAQPTLAVAATEHLGELLHASLRDDTRAEVTVDEEVLLAERYLALQRMRFGDRLQVEVHVPESAADCLVPVLLQPLVENAVVHGLDAGVACLHVAIRAQRMGATLQLTVENGSIPAGAHAHADETMHAPLHGVTAGMGVGLSATRARLHMMYGDRASLRLQVRATGGAEVVVTMPAVDGAEAAMQPSASAGRVNTLATVA